MASTDDADIPENGAVFTFGKSHFGDNLPNKFWVKNDKVLQVVCGDEHTALITETGRIFVFGANSMGQLGLPDVKSATKPSCIKSLKSEKSKLVACGRFHSVVATESGKLYSFGGNNEGQLGVEGIADAYSPTHISSLNDSLQYNMLSAGADHSVALTEDGRVFVWGGSSEGQLGLGHETEVPTPRELPFDENVVCIACGYYHTAVVTESGSLYTFGETEGGKLGLGENPAEYATPQHVSSIPEKVKAVACGGSHTVALTESGKVYTFGEGPNGQLGQGTSVLQSSVPHLLKVNFKISKVSCGENITAIISERGNLYTFGDGRHGKLALGQESFSNQFSPQKVDRFTKFLVEKAACGGCHMIVTAHRRVENGEVESEEELIDPSETLGQSLKGLDLNGSVSARVRRRQTMNHHTSPNMSLNRTLPSLGNNRTLPALNGHATLPALKNQENLLHTVPAIKLDKKKGKEESEESETEEKVKKKKSLPQPLPRSSPKGKAPKPKDSDGEGSKSEIENNRPHSDGGGDRGEEDRWSSEEEKEEVNGVKEEIKENGLTEEVKENGLKDDEDEEDEDELSEEEEKDDEKPRAQPVPTPRKKQEEDESGEEEEEKEEKEDKKSKKDKKKEKDKKKKKGLNLFGGKKGAAASDEEDAAEEEADDEDDEEKKEEDVKGKKKKDKKDKKGKKKDKKKKDKDKEEEDDDDEDEDKEEEKKSKKDKKKDKDKKKKKKGKKTEEESEKEEETEEKDTNENAQEKKDGEQEKKEEETKPKKKSRFCTIL